MKKLVLTIFAMLSIILISNRVSAQGILKGKIIDSQNLSLPGASIVLKGTTTGSVSDQSGAFSILNLTEGSYDLLVTYLGYSPISQTVEISNGKTTLVTFKMVETTLEGREVIVFGDRLKGQARALNQ